MALVENRIKYIEQIANRAFAIMEEAVARDNEQTFYQALKLFKSAVTELERARTKKIAWYT